MSARRKSKILADWRQFLAFGEELLKLPDSAAQCHLIVHHLSSWLSCQVEVWLCSPYFPLPGEKPVPIIENIESQSLVFQVATTGQKVNLPDTEFPTAIILPIITQKMILGVLKVSSEKPFSSQEKDLLEGLVAHIAVSLQVSRQVILKNWRYEQLSLVRQVSAKIANLLDLDDLSKQVTRLIQESFNYYYVGLFTYNKDENHLKYTANACANPKLSNKQLSMGFVEMGEGIIGTVAETRQEIHAPDVKNNPHYRLIDALPGTQSEYAVPIMVENRLLGVLDVQSDRLDSFHEIDQLVLKSLADNIALAVEGASLYARLQRHNEQIQAIIEINHALTSILDVDQLLQEVVQRIQQRFGYPFVHIFSVHPGRRLLFYMAGSGGKSQAMKDMDVTIDLDDRAGIIPFVGRTGHTYLANDVSQDPIYRPSVLPPENTQSEIAIPLVFGTDILAVLDIQSEHKGEFDDEDRSLLESLAAGVAISIRNATLYRSEQWRRQVGESFRGVAGLLSTNMALNQLLDSILIELEKNLPSDASAIWLIDQAKNSQRDTVLLAASHGIDREKIIQATQESEEIRTWLASVIDDPEPTIRRPEDSLGPLGAALKYEKDYSSIGAPLISGGKPIGLLTLAHHTSGRYGSEAKTMTATFASYAAVAIQNARLYADAQEEAWISTILLQVAEASQTISSIEELLATMIRLVRLLVGVKKCGFFIFDVDKQAFELKEWYGLDRQPVQTTFLATEVPAFARLIDERSTQFIQDAEFDLNLPYAALPANTGTLVMIPLLARETLLGAFLVAHEKSAGNGSGKSFSEHTLSIIQGISQQTAVTLENLRLVEARQEEAYVTAVLLQVAQAVVSQSDLSDILDTIVHLMPILVGIDACVIYLWDSEKGVYHTAQVFTGSRPEELELLSKDYSDGAYPLLDRVRQSDASQAGLITVPDYAPRDWPNLTAIPLDEINDVKSHSLQYLAAFPLSVKGEIYGVLVAKESHPSPSLQEKRLEIINGIAQQISLAIQNDRLKEQMVLREIIEREVQVARSIQRTFLPNKMPKVPGWEFDARWQTARQVGGDFYDIFRLGRDRMGLVIADVSDKGIPAALYMTVARTLLRAYAHNSHSPAAVLQRVNNLLLTDTPTGMFVTAVFAVLYPETGVLIYANAGHNKPFIQRSTIGQLEELPKGGMALGVSANSKTSDHSLQVNPGDCVIFYTDGVTETFAPNNDAFGEDRLNETLCKTINQPAAVVLDTIENALSEFRNPLPLSDDQTLLAIRRFPKEF